jgi:hypothetical protein
MAMGKSIIATTAAMEGIPHHENLAVSVADDADMMVKQINLLLDARLLTLDSNNNREFVKTQFSWQQNVSRLSQMLKA